MGLRHLRQKKGFTLVELLIASAITVLAVVGAISLYMQYQQNFLLGSTYLDAQSSARLAMDWMVKDIRWGRNVVKTYGVYTTSDSVIIIKVPSINSSTGDVLTDLNGYIVYYDYIIYRVQSNNLQRIVDAVSDPDSKRTDETRTIIKDCNSLTFESDTHALSYYTSAEISALTEIDISLTTSKTMPSLPSAVQKTITSSVKLRNRI